MYAAFLRAINVGGHVVKMDLLRQLFASMGFTRVSTFIASGNVCFETGLSDRRLLEKTISSGLAGALGYPVAAFVRTDAELQEIARFQPFPEAGSLADASLYIGLLSEPLDAGARQTVLSFRSPVDDFQVSGREIYWLCRIRSSDSTFSLARLEKALGAPATFRNATTIRRMAELYRKSGTTENK